MTICKCFQFNKSIERVLYFMHKYSEKAVLSIVDSEIRTQYSISVPIWV